MKQKIVNILNGTISRNIASLGLVQVANYLIPIVIIPIIVRILGAELFGRISYAQNIVSYLTLLVNFGFEYSATRQIALLEHDKEAQRRVFWSVIFIKVLLLLVSFMVLLGLGFCFDRVTEDPKLYWYAAITNIGFVLFPTWYLQGIQDMPRMAWTNFSIKLLGAILIICSIHHAEQYRLYPLLLSVASVAGGLAAMIYVVRRYELGSPVWDKPALNESFRLGLPIFVNNLFVSLYTAANLTILGLYACDEQIGYFSGAQRLIIAVNMCVVMPVSTAIFPRMSQVFVEDRQKGKRFFKQVLLGATAAAALISVVTYVAAPLIVRIMLGDSFEPSIALLRTMSPLPMLIMAATILTVQGMYGMGLQRFAPMVGVVLAALCVTSNVWLIPRVGVSGAIWSWIIAEAAEVALVGTLLLFFNRRKTCSI